MTMRLALHGGFGEKGRTCVGVEHDGYRVLLDAGVMTSARGRPEYYPSIDAGELAATDMLVFTHGHEDHVAALGWCIERGFAGRVLMTEQTRREAFEVFDGYAEGSERAAARAAAIEPLPVGGSTTVGPLHLSTGRSGHVAGGVWVVLDDGQVRFGYCGDVVPASPVFAMDPLPHCDAIALDASYGDDDVQLDARAQAIAAWVARHPQGVVLPTPLFGRSAELLAMLPGTVALAPGMRAALRTQLEERAWLHVASIGHLEERLAAARDWTIGEPLPAAALICHDGMGMAGPSRAILAAARATAHPTLFTGHVPARTQAADMIEAGAATWIRLPTHPTCSENVTLAAASGARLVLGHSCEPPALARLARHLPRLRIDVATGDRIEL